MATTRSRPPHGREQARHATGGTAAEHAGKIYAVVIGGAIVVLAFLTLTSIGHVIDAAVQHFMLYYAGVFALIALCASVALGFVATDRMILGPGHRIFIQSAHRAVSFGALAFLVVHIITEILAQRVHVLDAFIPFLSPFRTFYIGLGTIASDLIILLVITSIFRKRFTTNGRAWKWRAIHYASYLSFAFGVWHGLLGGRPGKPYVDWSYGFLVAVVVLGLVVRIISNSLRPKEMLSSPPVPESAANAGSAPMRAASMFAQLGVARAAAAGGMGGTGPMMAAGGGFAALAAGRRNTGAMPAVAALAAPVIADVVSDTVVEVDRGTGAYSGPRSGELPVYEPGYDGPPRYRGAPRNSDSGPMPRAATGSMPAASGRALPRAATGPQPRAASGPLPRAGTGPLPQAGSGPLPRAGSGPLPRAGTGPLPRAASGPLPRAGSGPLPRAARSPLSGPMPRASTGPMPTFEPHSATGPLPRASSGSFPAVDGPPSGLDAGRLPPADPIRRPMAGPRPQAGRSTRPATGPRPQAPVPPAGPPAGERQRPPVPPRPRPLARPAQRPAPGPQQEGTAPWDRGIMETDPGLRYREPGPGMPGYRGGTPIRGADPYAPDPYAAELHDGDAYPSSSPASVWDGNAYDADAHGPQQSYGAQPAYGAQPYGGDGYRDDAYGGQAAYGGDYRETADAYGSNSGGWDNAGWDNTSWDNSGSNSGGWDNTSWDNGGWDGRQ